MTTIQGLQQASTFQPSDLLMIAQGQVTRCVAVGALLSTVKAVAIVVAAGTAQDDATGLFEAVNVVAVVAEGAGVRLPQHSCTVVANRGVNDLTVYPPTDARIEGGAANAGVTVPAGGSASFVSADFVDFYAL